MGAPDVAPAMPDPKFFEEFEPGETDEFGSHTVTQGEIRRFAERYDPQPLHTDPEAASETMYGGLIASGWQTAGVTMRMIVDNVLNHAASLGARGVDELRWYRPVRPGDTLSVRTEVLETEVETEDRGLVRYRAETLRDDGTVVMSFVGLGLFARRP